MLGYTAMNLSRRRLLLGSALSIPGLRFLLAQRPARESYVPRQSDRPEWIEGDETGFEPISNGRNLDGCEGNATYWRVENESLVGEITPDTIVRSNTFVVWRGGRPKDFELKLDYRITPEGNSGINYRSAVIPDPVTPSNRFAMRGYQCDIDGRKMYSGNNYEEEEKGRLFLAVRGQVTHVLGTQKPIILSRFADPQELAHRLSGLELGAPHRSRQRAEAHHERLSDERRD